MPSPLQLLPVQTYLSMIRGSVGSQAYRHLFAMIDERPVDIIENGALACAFFVSHILLLFRLIKEPHTRVVGTIRDLEASGWIKTETPHEGALLVWEVAEEAGSLHPHIGFFMKNNEAISNSTEQGVPVTHHWTYNDTRKVEAIYTHPTFFGR